MHAPQYLQCSLITILRQKMKLKDKLSRVLAGQDFDGLSFQRDELERYKAAALCYAMTENAVAVLSDMRTNTSYIYYGGYARVLGLDRKGEHDEVCSIWEEEILKRIHPDDLADKYLQELRFFRFIKRRPQSRRGDYHLITTLRMKSAGGSYVRAVHRMFYVSASSSDGLWLAMCLYGPLPEGMQWRTTIVNTVDGSVTELNNDDDRNILSEREKQTLRLIDSGMMSKDIAAAMSISINTVSRHRQDILRKLQVRNSIEACRMARQLGLI